MTRLEDWKVFDAKTGKFASPITIRNEAIDEVADLAINKGFSFLSNDIRRMKK